MKKILISALFLGLVTFGCENCPDDGPPYFDINSMWVSESNSFMKPETAQDSIPFAGFRIMIEMDGEYYSSRSNPGFSFVPSAYASQPDDCMPWGYSGTQEKVEQLNLIALSNYNTQYQAGDTLNDIAFLNYDSLSNFTSGTNIKNLPARYFYITLTQKPDPKIKHAFRLDLKLQNG